MNLFAKLPFKKGFTLLELLVVIAILGILLSVGFVFYQRALQNARDQTRISDLSNVKIALEQYFSDDNFDYPASNAGKINCGGSDLNWGTDSLDCDGIYMKILPRDPGGSPQYCYEAFSSPPRFNLYAQMENDNNANMTQAPFCGSGKNYRVQSER